MLTSETQENLRPRVTDGFSESTLVAISILNWNGWEDTLECLESVRGLDYPNYLTVVLDNGSSNGSADKIKAWAEANLGPGHVIADYSRETALAGGNPQTEQALGQAPSARRMVLIRNEENLGFTGGNNVAMHYAIHRTASAGYVFVLNSDALSSADCLRQLVSASERSCAGIVGSMVVDLATSSPSYTGPLSILGMFLMPFVPWQRLPLEGEEFWHSDFVPGTGMLVRSEVLMRIAKGDGHYFDNRLFLYGEDIELCVAARRRGYKVIIAKDAIIYHKASNRSSRSRLALVTYYLHRNGVLQCRDLLPKPWGTIYYLLGPSLRIAKALKRYAYGRPVSGKAVICGLFDGYRGKTGKWKWHDREVALDVSFPKD